MIRLTVKKNFKVSSTFKRDGQLTGGTQCHSVPNRKSRLETGGPQTKIYDILKALVEETASFEEKRQCFFEIIQV